MKLSAHQLNLSGVLAKGDKGFSVPDFQRNYSWTQAETYQFWLDILNLVELDLPDHFLGPVVVLENESGRIPIIDGQQRLTTLTTLAAIIRDYLVVELQNPTTQIGEEDVYVTNLVFPILQTKDDNLTFSNLESNYQIRAIFEDYVIKSPRNTERKNFSDRPSQLTKAEKKASKNLEAAQRNLMTYLKDWLVKFPNHDDKKEKLIKLIDALKRSVQFLYIEVVNEEDAFTIFETLNDRGLKLSPGDLIKSYLLRKILEQNQSADREALIDSWEKISTNLAEYDVSNFLRHYLLTQEDEPVQKKKIFTLVKQDVEKSSRTKPQAAKQKLEELIAYSFHYGRLIGCEAISEDSTETQRRFELLAMIGDSYRVFLLQVLNLGFADEQLEKAITACERLAFRWIICGDNAQQLETKFQTQARTLVKGDTTSLDLACKNLIAEAPNDERLKAVFTLNTSRDTKMQAYVMRSLVYGLTGSDVTTDRREVSVEHIAPQNPSSTSSDYWFANVAPKESEGDSPSYEDFVFNWGNITILEKKLNSSVRDGEWITKVNGNARYKGYSNSQIALNPSIRSKDQWSADLITKRAKWISEQAIRYWRRDLEPFVHGSLSDFE
jgi:hypothetical protein